MVFRPGVGGHILTYPAITKIREYEDVNNVRNLKATISNGVATSKSGQIS